MTDKEKAEKYATENLPDGYTKVNYEKKEAYLAGFAEGKPKWHDLRKNPDDLRISGMVEELGEKLDTFFCQILEKKVSFCESSVSNVMATFIDEELKKELSFAESKNKKLAQVYFAGLNIQIEEMLKEEN